MENHVTSFNEVKQWILLVEQSILRHLPWKRKHDQVKFCNSVLIHNSKKSKGANIYEKNRLTNDGLLIPYF